MKIASGRAKLEAMRSQNVGQFFNLKLRIRKINGETVNKIRAASSQAHHPTGEGLRRDNLKNCPTHRSIAPVHPNPRLQAKLEPLTI
jgi:hypothetical protein